MRQNKNMLQNIMTLKITHRKVVTPQILPFTVFGMLWQTIHEKEGTRNASDWKARAECLLTGLERGRI